jgi:hypothetical protein
MRHARRLGLSIRLVTNAHWAQTQEAAGRCLDELIASGLTHVTVSTGDEHVRFVPLASVINAARGCVERKLPASIAVEASMGRAVSARALQDNACFQEILASFPDAALDVVDSTWMPLSPFRYGRYGKDETVNKDNLDRRRGCEQIFSTTRHQDIENWERDNITYTLRKKRKAFFDEMRKLRVPKTGEHILQFA